MKGTISVVFEYISPRNRKLVCITILNTTTKGKKAFLKGKVYFKSKKCDPAVVITVTDVYKIEVRQKLPTLVIVCI